MRQDRTTGSDCCSRPAPARKHPGPAPPHHAGHAPVPNPVPPPACLRLRGTRPGCWVGPGCGWWDTASWTGVGGCPPQPQEGGLSRLLGQSGAWVFFCRYRLTAPRTSLTLEKKKLGGPFPNLFLSYRFFYFLSVSACFLDGPLLNV